MNDYTILGCLSNEKGLSESLISSLQFQLPVSFV
jgi:hypothetical protein